MNIVLQLFFLYQVWIVMAFFLKIIPYAPEIPGFNKIMVVKHIASLRL